MMPRAAVLAMATGRRSEALIRLGWRPRQKNETSDSAAADSTPTLLILVAQCLEARDVVLAVSPFMYAAAIELMTA